MSSTLRVGRDQVLAFRLASHHLAHRLPAGALLQAAGACGLQNTPPGSAMLALSARVEGLSVPQVTQALETEKTLLQTRSLRGAPHVFPTGDLPVFGTGLLPEDEESLRFFILGAGPALDKVGISATALAELAASGLLDVLDGRMLPFRQLSSEMTAHLRRQLPGHQLPAWDSPSDFAAGMSLGEALVHFALYPTALQGLYCYAAREGGEAAFVRTDQWLCGPLPQMDPALARAELVRRYLRCYGPSTATHFREWAGVSPAAAQTAWAAVEPEMVDVSFEGKPAWLLRSDLDGLSSPSEARDVRLLPPHDPYLQQRDRQALLPDRAAQRAVWRTVGNPGVVLSGGKIVALWRPQKKGRRLTVTVQALAGAGLPEEEIVTEANRMAPLRGCDSAQIVFSGQEGASGQ